jgi:hypothetical protein
MVRDKKDVMCWTRGTKSGKSYTTCVDKTNAQLQKAAKPKEGRYKAEPTPKTKPRITQPEQLRKLSVVELRKLARGRGKTGAEVSLMRKEELVNMLASQPKRKVGKGKEEKAERPYNMEGKRKKKN